MQARASPPQVMIKASEALGQTFDTERAESEEEVMGLGPPDSMLWASWEEI